MKLVLKLVLKPASLRGYGNVGGLVGIGKMGDEYKARRNDDEEGREPS